MKYFRDGEGDVFAFDSDGSQDKLVLPSMSELTPAELEIHLNPPPTRQELEQIEVLWRASQMPIARENVTSIEFGDDQIPGTAAEWKTYWLALRGWVEGAEGYPDSTHRPIKPT